MVVRMPSEYDPETKAALPAVEYRYTVPIRYYLAKGTYKVTEDTDDSETEKPSLKIAVRNVLTNGSSGSNVYYYLNAVNVPPVTKDELLAAKEAAILDTVKAKTISTIEIVAIVLGVIVLLFLVYWMYRTHKETKAKLAAANAARGAGGGRASIPTSLPPVFGGKRNYTVTK